MSLKESNDRLPGDIPAPAKTDKELIRERFYHKFDEYDRLARAQKRICKALSDEMRALIPPSAVGNALEIGAGTGFLTQDMVRRYPDSEWHLNDLIPEAGEYLSRYTPGVRTHWLWGDAEKMDFPQGLDLITSACTIQWFSDITAFARKAAAATQPGGWLALSTFGPDNFKEIRATTGDGLEYLSTEELAKVFSDAGYEIKILRDWYEQLSMDDPSAVLRHIKETGVNSVKKAAWGPDRFEKFNADYKRLFSTPEGHVTLTFHPVIIIAQKK